MKLRIVLLSGVIFSVLSCSEKKKEEWKEFSDYHALMSIVYHPLKDSGDLAPAKRMAKKLALSADRLASAPLPANVNNEKVKLMVLKLNEDSQALSMEILKGAPDDVIKEKLTALHSEFHQLMETWEGGDQHDEKHEEEED